MKLWIDDTRPAPAGFEWARDARAAIRAIAAGEVEFVAFDHFLGGGLSGYDVACLIEDLARDGIHPPGWSAHSSDGDACRRIDAAMLSAHHIYNRGYIK